LPFPDSTFAWAVQGFRSYVLLTLLCAAVFLPGLAAIPPTDRDEARFMQATKQMLESGDWVHIRFQDEPRNKKPIGIYWLQALSMRASGADLTAAWPYRVPSALAAWLAVLATCFAGRRLFNPAAGLTVGAVLATSLVVVAEAHIAKTDAALLAATTIALVTLGLFYVNARETRTPFLHALPLWLALGAGILIKGPVILLVAGVTVVALCIADRNASWLKSAHVMTGVPVMLIVVLPWIIAVSGGAGNGGGNFLADAIRGDMLPKLIGGQESHGAPPGTHLLATLATAWPWSVLVPFVLVAAWKQRAVPAVRFCLAWLIPAWIVFEIVPTKLPHYTMPMFPALALLIAWSLSTVADFPRWVGHKAGLAYRIVWACVAIALAVGISLASRLYGDGTAVAATMTIAIVIATGLFALFGFARVNASRAVMGLTALGSIFAITLSLGFIPPLRQLAISPRLAEVVARQQTSAPVALAGYHEPSAIFLLGTKTVLTDAPGAAAHLLGTPGAIAAVPEDTLETIRAAFAAANRRLVQLEEIPGYNYSRGRWLRLVVITAAPEENNP